MDPYTRHYGLWTPAQQRRLAASCVAVGGVGGIGAAEALLLAKTGIGRIKIADRDAYESENIVEQAFATWDTVRQSKTDAARKEMERHQRGISVEAQQADLSQPELAAALVEDANLLFSGVDNPSARIELGRAALRRKIPFIVAANVGWTAFYTTYQPECGGYAAAFARRTDLRLDRDGFPMMSDETTRASVELDWCMWTVALSGFRKQEVRRLIRGDLSYLSYAAAPAFAAASFAVAEGVRSLLKMKIASVFPALQALDLRSGCMLSRRELNRRYRMVATAWSRGESEVFRAVQEL